MHYKTACKIKSAKVSYPAANTPHPMCKRGIYKGCPEYEEYKICLEFEPFSKCACYKRRGDYSKHHLEYHECLMRNSGRIIRIWLKPDPSKPDPFKSTYYVPLIRTKCKTIPIKHPYKRNDTQRYKALHYSSKDIFSPYHSTVKKRKSRGHQHNKGSRD